MNKKQSKRPTIRAEQEDDEQPIRIEQVEKLLGRDQRTIRRWRQPRLVHCKQVGRAKFYRVRDVIRVGLAHGVAVQHQPTDKGIIQSRAVGFFRQGMSVDEAAEEVPMFVSEAARVFWWWEAMAGMVTFRAPAVRVANRVLACTASEEHHLHLGIHLPGKPGLAQLLDSALRLLKAHPQCMADRESLEREANRPLFSDPVVLDRELEEAASLPPASASSHPRKHRHGPPKARNRNRTTDENETLSRRVCISKVAEMLGLSTRQVERISKRHNTPLPVRENGGRGRGRGRLFDRADVMAYLNRKAPVVLPKRQRAAKAAKLFRHGHNPDSVMVQLQMSCAEATHAFFDWANEHAACIEGHLPPLALEQMDIRGMPMWGLIDEDWDTRDKTLVELAKAVVRMDRERAELGFVRGLRSGPTERPSGVRQIEPEEPSSDVAS